MQVVQEYERAVIFRIGRLLPGGAKGPGKGWFENMQFIVDLFIIQRELECKLQLLRNILCIALHRVISEGGLENNHHGSSAARSKCEIILQFGAEISARIG